MSDRDPVMPISSAIAIAPPALQATRRELETRATGRVSWYQDGPASAPGATPLLLVHSINAAGSAYEVKPLFEHYRETRPVYALDLPGFGLSARDDRKYDPRLMTAAIDAVVAVIGREHGGIPVDALALSLSSEFLARSALGSPAAYRSLAFVSPTGFDSAKLREGAPGSTLGRPGMRALFTQPAWRRGLFELLTRRGVIRYFLRRSWGADNIDPGMLDYDYAITRAAGAEYAPLQFLSGYLFSGDSGHVYRALSQPVWAVHGVRGDFHRYPGLAQMAARTNWTIEVFPTGALPHFELPAEFVQRYDAWSRGLDAGMTRKAA
jgi:pimeloyl-ACP methyl ester carboxylesterase